MSGVSQEGMPQEGQNNVFTEMSKYNVMAVQEHIYDILPKVFIDGYSLVKISLTNNYVNCGNYMSRSGLTFGGCAIYSKHGTNDELADVRGIYYPLNAPVYYFNAGRKISRDIEEMKQIVLNQVQSLASHMRLNRRLLIKYTNYGAEVYDKFVRGKVIKFPLTLEQGHLFISWVPRVPTELPYEKVTQLELYNHKIELEKEVIRFKINVLAGQADLVYNYHDTHIKGVLRSPDHEKKEVELMHGSFHLITHQRPTQRRGID